VVACAWRNGLLQAAASGVRSGQRRLNRSSTPPLGAFGLGLPIGRRKNGNRASRVGPLAVMNDGMVLVTAHEPVGDYLEWRVVADRSRRRPG